VAAHPGLFDATGFAHHRYSFFLTPAATMSDVNFVPLSDKPGTVRYWSTFQTGLEYEHGQPKPSLAAYRLPVSIPQPSFAPGTAVGVWAMLRTAAAGTTPRARVQWRPAHGPWRTLAAGRARAVDRAVSAVSMACVKSAKYCAP